MLWFHSPQFKESNRSCAQAMSLQCSRAQLHGYQCWYTPTLLSKTSGQKVQPFLQFATFSLEKELLAYQLKKKRNDTNPRLGCQWPSHLSVGVPWCKAGNQTQRCEWTELVGNRHAQRSVRASDAQSPSGMHTLRAPTPLMWGHPTSAGAQLSSLSCVRQAFTLCLVVCSSN